MKDKTFCFYFLIFFLVIIIGCAVEKEQPQSSTSSIPEVQYCLTEDQTHNKFSRLIPPVLKVPSGSVIEVFTKEAAATLRFYFFWLQTTLLICFGSLPTGR